MHILAMCTYVHYDGAAICVDRKNTYVNLSFTADAEIRFVNAHSYTKTLLPLYSTFYKLQ